MSQEKRELADLFSATSSLHDSVGGLFAHFGALLVDLAGLSPGDRVLDLASGTGASLVPAANRVGPTGHITGVEIAPGMVAMLRKKIAELGLESAEVRVGDAENLAFEDSSIDAVLCGFGLFFFPDPKRALAEVCRVLRPGGVVALSTFTRAGSASMDETWRQIGEFIPVPPPAHDERRFHEPGQLIRALDEAGFAWIDVRPSPFELVLTSVDEWIGWLRSMEFSAYLEQFTADQLEGFRDAAASRFASQAGSARIRMDALLTRAAKPS